MQISQHSTANLCAKSYKKILHPFWVTLVVVFSGYVVALHSMGALRVETAEFVVR